MEALLKVWLLVLKFLEPETKLLSRSTPKTRNPKPRNCFHQEHHAQDLALKGQDHGRLHGRFGDPCGDQPKGSEMATVLGLRVKGLG